MSGGRAAAGQIATIVGQIRSGEITAAEVTSITLGEIDRLNGERLPREGGASTGLNAFLEVFHERAMEQARAIDTRLASGEDRSGERLPLAGVPIAVKDNICMAWGRTTAGSRMLEQYRSPFNATVVTKLVEAGAVIVGKTNLDEFSMGSSGERSAFGATRNPWDPDRVPGGSSGGSAAAVGAGLVPAALGSDTGGSIRQPASHCGVVGMKPTYGRVSRYGLVAYASSLDQIGPLGATVGDVARVLSVIMGQDPLDATSVSDAGGDGGWPGAALDAGLDEGLSTLGPRLRIGVPVQAPRAGHEQGNHPAVVAAFGASCRALRDAGATLVEIDLEHIDHGIAAYYIIALAEASSNLARYDGVRYGRRAALGPGEGLIDLYERSRTEGFGEEVRRRILLGTHVLSSGYYEAYYATALKARRLIKRDFDRAFAKGGEGPGVDAVLLPASPQPAFGLGEKLTDPLAMYLEDVYTVGANLAGLPAITVPAGYAEAIDVRAENGAPAAGPLPVGVQLLGPAFAERELLRVARVLEAYLPQVRPTPVVRARIPWHA